MWRLHQDIRQDFIPNAVKPLKTLSNPSRKQWNISHDML